MWKFIKDCWNDWTELENTLAKQGIFRIRNSYSVFKHCDITVKKEKSNEHKKDTVV